MKFHQPFNPIEKIQLLQRWILVQSFAYYELDSNIASDFTYDDNAKQLAELKKEYPEAFKRSRYYEYFHDYCSEDDDAHYTSGFDLIDRVRRGDEKLYRHIWIDAALALDLKDKRGIDALKDCLEFAEFATVDGRAVAFVDDVKTLIDKFPKEPIDIPNLLTKEVTESDY